MDIGTIGLILILFGIIAYFIFDIIFAYSLIKSFSKHSNFSEVGLPLEENKGIITTINNGVEVTDEVKSELILESINKTGYDFLYEICKDVRNRGTALLKLREPLTDRASFIVNKLNEMGFTYKITPFSISQVSELGYGEGKLINIEVFFPATIQTDKNIFYTAHHDIANPESENCQDNTASVCNLLDLCKQVSEMKIRERNVYIVFTDCEEMGGKGMNRLLYDIKQRNLNVDIMLCLELTANGTEYWASCGASEKDGEGAKKFAQLIGNTDSFVGTPYNESVNARHSGLNAICVGSLKKEEMEKVQNNRFCSTWSLCHSERDTFELSANREEMSGFVEFLKRFINE